MPGVVYFSHFSNYGITVYVAHEALSIMQAEVEDLRSEVWKYKPAEQAEKDDAGAKSDVPRQHGGWMPKMAQMITSTSTSSRTDFILEANRCRSSLMTS